LELAVNAVDSLSFGVRQRFEDGVGCVAAITVVGKPLVLTGAPGGLFAFGHSQGGLVRLVTWEVGP
jgi:hypothetical protein